MTYFLEKIYKVNEAMQQTLASVCIRPSKLSYREVIDMFRKNKAKSFTLDGCIDNWFPYRSQQKDYEEWLIKQQLENNINLDFEVVIFYDETNYELNTYAAKMVDLHTNKVLADAIDKMLEQIKSDREVKF